MAVFSHLPGGGGFYPHAIKQSCRFDDDSGAYQYSTFGAPTDGTLWTYSTWLKRSNISSNMYLIEAGVDASNRTVVYFSTANQLAFYSYYGAAVQGSIVTQSVLRDTSAWYHFLGQFDSANNTFKFFVNGIEQPQTVTTAVTAGTHYINGNTYGVALCRHQNSALTYYDGYLAETHFVDGQALVPADFGELKNGIWVPIKYEGTYGNNGFHLDYSNSSDFGEDQSGNSNDFTDSGLATEDQFPSTPTKNGFTALSTYPNDGKTTYYNGNINVTTILPGVNGWIGTMELPTSGKWYWEVYNSQAIVDASTRGGIRQINQGVGLHNNYNMFSGNGDITTNGVNDSTGNSNWQNTYLMIAVDMDALKIWFGINGVWQQSGDPAAGTNESATIASGCVYVPFGLNTSGVANSIHVIYSDEHNIAYTKPAGFKFLNSENLPEPEHLEGNEGFDAVIYTGSDFIDLSAKTCTTSGVTLSATAARCIDGDLVVNAWHTDASSSGAWIKVDLGSGNDLEFGKVGINMSGACASIWSVQYSDNDSSWSDAATGWNPTGAGMNMLVLTPPGAHRYWRVYLTNTPGAGAYQQELAFWTDKAITDLEFSPDLVWLKSRDQGSSPPYTGNHHITDTLRGATITLYPDLPNAEDTQVQGVKSFDSNGFTLGTQPNFNYPGDLFVAWNWLEDPAYGFDIVSYTGTGAAKNTTHNLGVVPEMMIVKNRDEADGWFVYHKGLTSPPQNYYLYLHSSAARVADSIAWYQTPPISTLFTVGTGLSYSGEDYIAYLFASVAGYSKVFSYTGNASADGPFVHCGFRPRFIMLKNQNAAEHWIIVDTERNTYNLTDAALFPNSDIAENTANVDLDILSNGFKIRGSLANYNGSGNTIIGIAFAEHPFKYANAR